MMISYARLCRILDTSYDLASPFLEELLCVKMFSQTKFLSFIKVAMQTSSREKKINKNFQYLASHVSLQFLQIVLKNIEQKVSGARLGSG